MSQPRVHTLTTNNKHCIKLIKMDKRVFTVFTRTTYIFVFIEQGTVM